MSISLTPEQIQDLARQINEAIRGLTNIEDILEATRADLARARALEQRANRAKSDIPLSFVTRLFVCLLIQLTAQCNSTREQW